MVSKEGWTFLTKLRSGEKYPWVPGPGVEVGELERDCSKFFMLDTCRHKFSWGKWKRSWQNSKIFVWRKEYAGGNHWSLIKVRCFRQLWIFCPLHNFWKNSSTWTKLQVSSFETQAKESYKQIFVTFNGSQALLEENHLKSYSLILLSLLPLATPSFLGGLPVGPRWWW